LPQGIQTHISRFPGKSANHSLGFTLDHWGSRGDRTLTAAGATRRNINKNTLKQISKIKELKETRRLNVKCLTY